MKIGTMVYGGKRDQIGKVLAESEAAPGFNAAQMRFINFWGKTAKLPPCMVRSRQVRRILAGRRG